jgi:hypothetical protein
MSIKEHLDKLKSFKPTYSDVGVNKLYFLEVDEKPNMVKVGDTRRDVVVRNQETMTNASLHRKKGTKPTWVIAKKWDNSVYRDKEFHAFLRRKGYEFDTNNQDNNSEWVLNVTVEQLLTELSEFTGKPEYKVVELRPAQQYVITQLQEALDTGHQHNNAGICVRLGKTIATLTFAANNNCMPVYLGKNLTSQSSAEADNAEYGIVPQMLTQSLHGVDELGDDGLSKLTKQIIDNIDQANTNNKEIVFIIDEVDDASHTKQSCSISVPIFNHYKQNGKFKCLITMSGTRIYRGERVLRQVTDGPIKELSLEYYEMQILQPDTTCRRNFRHISFYSENAYGLLNVSDAMKNRDTGHKSLATIIKKLLGTNNFGFTVNDNFPHWFIKFSTVGKDNANAFVKFLNRNYSIIENKEYYFTAINGKFTTNKQAQDYCKDIIKKQPDKICVFITQGMATTSFSVAEIGNSVVFTDNQVTSDDVQALHRSATWVEGKPECNMILVTTNDSKELSFDDIFEEETKIASSREEKVEIYKELLNNNSMVHFMVNGTSVLPVKITEQNVELFIDKKMKSMTKIASIMMVLNELDEDLINIILDTVDGRRNTSKKSNSARPSKFDPFGELNNVIHLTEVDNETSAKNVIGHQMTSSQREKILRAFAESAVTVPAIAREQETTIDEFEYWGNLNISKELFFDVYNASTAFKDRIDAIYNLCSDGRYLVENYISKLSA